MLQALWAKELSLTTSHSLAHGEFYSNPYLLHTRPHCSGRIFMKILVGVMAGRVYMRQYVSGGCSVFRYLQRPGLDGFVVLLGIVGNVPFIFFYCYFSLR